MRIISKYKDYYDGVMSQGQDDGLLFIRERQIFQSSGKFSGLAHLAQFEKFAQDNVPGDARYQALHKDVRWAEVTYSIVVFCGKVYPVACVALTGATHASTIFIHSAQQLAQCFKDYEVQVNKRARYRWNSMSRSGKREAFFGLAEGGSLMNWAVENKIAIAQLGCCEGFMQINPKLSDVEFFRCLGPYEAFQELSMFLGNLAAPERLPVIIEDKYRIAQHGFDALSFRKRPKG